MDLDPKTFPGFIFLQRWKQLGCRRGDRCGLHGARWRLIARTAAGVTAAKGTREVVRRTAGLELESKPCLSYGGFLVSSQSCLCSWSMLAISGSTWLFGTVLTSNHGDRDLLKPSYLPHLRQKSCSQHTWELKDAPQPPYRTLRGEGQGSGIWVKHQMDPVVLQDNSRHGMTELISLGTAREGWQNTQSTSQKPSQHNKKSTAELMGSPLTPPKAPHLPGMDPRTTGYPKLQRTHMYHPCRE